MLGVLQVCYAVFAPICMAGTRFDNGTCKCIMILVLVHVHKPDFSSKRVCSLTRCAQEGAGSEMQTSPVDCLQQVFPSWLEALKHGPLSGGVAGSRVDEAMPCFCRIAAPNVITFSKVHCTCILEWAAGGRLK